MFLERLNEYASRLDLPPTLYARSAVRYIITLDGEGRLLAPAPVDTADPSRREARRGEEYLVPRVKRTVAVRPLLLADNAEYTLGLAREGSSAERVAACHAAYRELLERCAAATGEPAVRAVCAFLAGDGREALALPEDLDAGASIAFRVAGQFVHDLPAVRAFWAEVNAPDEDGDAAPRMVCIVCGRERPVLRRLQTNIKGLPGGQTSGTSIISANAPAFESYGLEASLIAPTCASCGERFTIALNHLLRDPTAHLTMGGAALVCWTREEHPFNPFTFLAEPDPQAVLQLVEGIRAGRRPAPVDDTAFYAATLSGSGGRAVVRDWLDTTVAEAKRHLALWFARQQIVGEWGEPPEPIGIYALAACTVRDAKKDLAPPTMRALWRTALTGAPLPPALLAQALARARVQERRPDGRPAPRVTRARAGLIRLALAGHIVGSGTQGTEDTMVQLEPTNPSPAYQCGRLLAVIEEAQRQAIPGANATVVDRFYGTASSAPASVFGRLLRGVQPHLAKLKRDRPGAYVALQSRLEEIQSNLGAFPRVLGLEEQGLFALGYYHQRAADRAASREGAARKRASRDQTAEYDSDQTSDDEEGTP
jgi:CRISPR-associated protein Csd1